MRSADHPLIGKTVRWSHGSNVLVGPATHYDDEDDELFIVPDGLIHGHYWVPAAECAEYREPEPATEPCCDCGRTDGGCDRIVQIARPTENTTERKDTTMHALTKDDFTTRYDTETEPFPFVELGEGDFIVGLGHLDAAEFAASVTAYDKLCAGPSWYEDEATTEADVKHLHAVQVPTDDGWTIQWSQVEPFSAERVGAFPITLVSR